jgi:hypothetical protein
MPRTIADIDAVNRTHPTTRILPTEEQLAEQRAHRMRVVGIAALAGVGALAFAGGVYWAYRAGWLRSPPPSRARRALDAVSGSLCSAGETVRESFDSVGGSLRRGYDAAAERLRSMRAA